MAKKLSVQPDYPIHTQGDGDPFATASRKGSGVLDDILVMHMPHLALVSFEDFQRVIALRPSRQATGGKNTRGLHPLSGSWKCPRCGRFNLKIGGQRKWLRCAGAWAAGLTDAEMPCDAPPIDLALAESLMFRALETFAPGREANFASAARERYDEILDGAKVERRQTKEREERLKAELKLVAKELTRAQDNVYVRAALQEDADNLAAELESIQGQLQDTYVEVDGPDPRTSLLELGNMIEKIKLETPFGFAVNPEALQFRNRLNEVILAVNMVEKGDHLYDVEFVLNASAAIEQPGSATELVRFTDVDLQPVRFQPRRELETIAQYWEEGRYAISDRAWKKRPDLPHATRLAGDNLRWLVDTMIMTAETGLGTRAMVKIAGTLISASAVQVYRATAECTRLREWLQEVRTRKHEYARLIPRPCSAKTIRKRMEDADDFPLLRLDRFQRSEVAAPLTDAEYQRLVEYVPDYAGKNSAKMRVHVDELIEMVRFNHYANRNNGSYFTTWFNYQVKRGTLLKVVNFFLELEGRDPVASLPEIPNGGHRPKRD